MDSDRFKERKKKRAPLKEAVRRVRKGEDKHLVFEEFQNPEIRFQLAATLSNVPDQALWLRWRHLHIIFLASLIVITQMKIVSSLSFLDSMGVGFLGSLILLLLTSLINLIFIFFTLRRYGAVYQPAALLTALSIVQSPEWITGFSGYSSLGKLWVSITLLFSCTAVITGWLTGARIFPYLKFLKPQRDDEGLRIYTMEGR